MVWILPTLSRPAQCVEVLERIKAVGCSSKGVVFVNGESHRAGYEHAFCDLSVLPKGWKIVFNSENLGALGALNKVFADNLEEGFYGFIGDDEFLDENAPPDWDAKLIAAAGDWDFAHGIDSLHGGGRAQGYLCIGGKLARSVGYLAIPECWHWYGLDTMWETLTRSGACLERLVAAVKIDHRRPAASTDECYALGESSADVDFQVYAHWFRAELAKAARRVHLERRALAIRPSGFDPHADGAER
jgi:hypothetical protein